MKTFKYLGSKVKMPFKENVSSPKVCRLKINKLCVVKKVDELKS